MRSSSRLEHVERSLVEAAGPLRIAAKLTIVWQLYTCHKLITVDLSDSHRWIPRLPAASLVPPAIFRVDAPARNATVPRHGLKLTVNNKVVGWLAFVATPKTVPIRFFAGDLVGVR